MQENNRDDLITINTTPTLVSDVKQGTNAYRKLIIVTNTSTGGQIITLSTVGQSTSLKGQVLYPGGSMSDSIETGYRPSNERYTAVSSAAGGQLSLHEVVVMD